MDACVCMLINSTMHMCTQGYDMEDAMILNKASVERGLAHASVYKSEVYGHTTPLQYIDFLYVLYVYNIVDRFEQEEQ